MCFFDFDHRDMSNYLGALKKKKVVGNNNYRHSTASTLIRDKPLSFFKGVVRRHYLPGDVQIRRLDAWYERWIKQPLNAVDMAGRHIVANGPNGLRPFDITFNNQKDLCAAERLSGECLVKHESRILLHLKACVVETVLPVQSLYRSDVLSQALRYDVACLSSLDTAGNRCFEYCVCVV